MISKLIDRLLDLYIKHERKKSEKKTKYILPNYVTKRRIKIYNNGIIVFDSKNVDKIPPEILYTIKSYGIPKNIKPNNKTPLIYNVNTTLTSMFPNEQLENDCINSIS